MGDVPIPSNEDLLAYSDAVSWKAIEEQKQTFNETVKALAQDPTKSDTLPLGRTL